MSPDIALDVIELGDIDGPARIDHACSELGFFRIPARSIPDGVVDRAFAAAGHFFALSDEEKRRVEFPAPGYPYGYSPFAFETLAASTGDGHGPDLKESYSVGPDCMGAGHVALHDDASPDERWIRSPSLWPSALPELRPAWEQAFGAFADVSADLLSMMALALELPADHFAPLIDRHTSAMRALHYPPLSREFPPDSIRAGAHSDYGTLTILVTDGVPGLEVLDRDGSWRPVEHVPDTYVVNLGDSIAQWTNDRWRSTLHRVMPVSAAARRSMAFFHMANWDATIECLPTCRDGDAPPIHEPVLAGPWLMDKFQRTVASDR